jgi:glutamate synthase domain-containing protein 3
MKEEHKMAEYNKEENFKKELEQLINKYSQEGGSNTPDFILAHYMSKCLQNFNEITKERDKWYGRTDHVANTNIILEAPRND